MASIGFRIFCVTIAVLFFFESAFSTVFIGDTQSSELRENSYGGAFGYQSDGDSGLMLLGHRYYDASTGRFLSRDPVGDGSNWYVYCGNNPILNADPTGKILIPIFFIGAAAIIIGGCGCDTDDVKDAVDIATDVAENIVPGTEFTGGAKAAPDIARILIRRQIDIEALQDPHDESKDGQFWMNYHHGWNKGNKPNKKQIRDRINY